MSIRSKVTGEESGGPLLLHPSLVLESRQESPSNINNNNNSNSSPVSRYDYAMSQNANKGSNMPFGYTTVDDVGVNYDDGSTWANVSAGNNGQNIWSDSQRYTTVPVNNAYNFVGGGIDHADSLHTSFSTYNSNNNNNSCLGLLASSKEWNPSNSITQSIGELKLDSSQGQQHHQKLSQYPGGIVSVPSMAFSSGTGATIPGVVGASSGSTSGISSRSTSTWSDRPSSLLQHQHQQTTKGPAYSSQPFYSDPYAYSVALPNFEQHQQEDSYRGFPYHATINEDDSSSFHRGMNNNRGEQNRGNQQKGRPNGRNGRSHHSMGGRGGRVDSTSRQGTSIDRADRSISPTLSTRDDFTLASSNASSEAIRMLMTAPQSSTGSMGSSKGSALTANRLPLDQYMTTNSVKSSKPGTVRPILPSIECTYLTQNGDEGEEEGDESLEFWGDGVGPHSSASKKREWLLRSNRRISELSVGELDPSSIPVLPIMNAWAKTNSAQGAAMVEMWLKRIQEEADAGNTKIVPNTKMYTMAVDAWAKSGEGVRAAQRAEAILQSMHTLYQKTGSENLRPTTGIFNAVINAWARSKDKIAPSRAEQILLWMDNLHEANPALQIQPDKFTYNTVIHAYAKSGGAHAASKAQDLLAKMHRMHEAGNPLAKPDTITYNVVINAWAKSGGNTAAIEAEKLLARMHKLHACGDIDVKPNVVTYGAVIDSYAKSGAKGAAANADNLLAKMIHLHQMDPICNADLKPNTYVFNTVINCWAKSKEQDAASKAEEMLMAMNKLHASGMPNLKPDAFTYTAVIDAWSKSGYRGAAARADQLLDKMEAKFLAGDLSLRPNSFTYNAVINALAKSGEPGAAARAERVLQNMVNRDGLGASDDCKPTTINFNTILDAWAKSGGGRKAAERAEEILEWMDRLHKDGNLNCKPDTISFNAVIDAWARSGDRMAPHRAEQILDHMDELYMAGDHGKKPDVYSYNTLINAWAKSTERGSAARAEHVLRVMKQRYADGDVGFKPNTRTMTSVIDAWAKSGDKGAAKRAEKIFDNMINSYEATGDHDTRPNVHTANAVCNACAFTKIDEDRSEALQIAFRVFKWLSEQPDMEADSYTYTILLSVCANLLPREDSLSRSTHAKTLFEQCCGGGYVNEYVLRKLRQTLPTEQYIALTGTHGETTTRNLPQAWTRSIGRFSRVQFNKGRKKKGNWSQRHK